MSTVTETAVTEAVVLREDKDGVATLTLNRPKQFNALSEQVLAALQGELDNIAADASILGSQHRAVHSVVDQHRDRSSIDGFKSYDVDRTIRRTVWMTPQPVPARCQPRHTIDRNARLPFSHADARRLQ